jgi:hypothetical protein
MKTVYLSSTYEDLKEYRRAVADALRNNGYDVDAMEKYPARDDRPRLACESDAAKCDFYVGIIAWKYGFVPDEENPERKSITELEYLAAKQAQKSRLIFLVAEDASWPETFRDAEATKIQDLRGRLMAERWVASFQSKEDLALKVLTSVFQRESTKRVEAVEAIDGINAAWDFGPSYLGNIQTQIAQLTGAKFISIRLGPTPWWNTRLHLLAALASDLTEIRQIVILDADGSFLTMASPAEIRRALTKSFSEFERVYLQCREQARGRYGNEVELILANYITNVSAVFMGQQEAAIKQELTPAKLRDLGLKADGEALEDHAGLSRSALYSDALKRQKQFVAIMAGGSMGGVIDRLELASRIATMNLP